MEDEESTEQMIHTKTNTTLKTKPKGSNKPPPIVIKGKLHCHKTFLAEIKKITKKNITLKYAKNSVILYPDDADDYKTLLRQLKQEDTEFHTYTTAEEKTHAFVLRGLDGDISEEEIKHDLHEEYNMKIHNIYKMKNTFRPLYLIVTDSKYTVTKLNQEIKTVMAVRVTWENRRNQKQIVQCQRCQTWGHSRQNCTRKPRCSRCAESHEIVQCPNRDFESKCANCGGQHRAISTTCPVYQYRVNKLREKKLVDAPPPAKPAWQNKRPQNRNQEQPQRTQQRRRERNYDEEFPDTLSRRSEHEDTGRVTSRRGTAGMTQVRDLNDAFVELNSLIDLNEALMAVKHFTRMLREGGNTSREKFEIMTQFFNEILPKYKI